MCFGRWGKISKVSCDLETSLCNRWPWWMNVYWCITSKIFWFRNILIKCARLAHITVISHMQTWKMSQPGMSCIRRALQSTSLRNGTLPKSALWHFVTVFGADSLSETECCTATRQNKMAGPNIVCARFKKLNVFAAVVVLGWSALCINDHRTQNQSPKQASLAFYKKFPVWKSCHFGRYFKKRSRQTDRCIARTNIYRALPESASLMQLTPGICSQQIILNANSYNFRSGIKAKSDPIRRSFFCRS